MGHIVWEKEYSGIGIVSWRRVSSLKGAYLLWLSFPLWSLAQFSYSINIHIYIPYSPFCLFSVWFHFSSLYQFYQENKKKEDGIDKWSVGKNKEDGINKWSVGLEKLKFKAVETDIVFSKLSYYRDGSNESKKTLSRSKVGETNNGELWAHKSMYWKNWETFLHPYTTISNRFTNYWNRTKQENSFKGNSLS